MRVEVSAPEAFRGRLDGEARVAYFWKGQRHEETSVLRALRASAEIDVAAGAVQRTRLWFPLPFIIESRGDAREVTLDWTLRDASGRAVERRREVIAPTFWHGRLVTRYPTLPKARERFPPLGLDLVPPPREPPERGGEYSVSRVVVSASEVVRWSQGARQALFDTAAFGTMVLLTDASDLTLVPEPLRRALLAPDAVIWRGPDGAEMREVDHVRGILRTTTRSGTAAPFEPWDERDPLLQLGLSLSPTLPHWQMKLVGPEPKRPSKGQGVEGKVNGPILRADDGGRSPADEWLRGLIVRFQLETLVPLAVALGFLVVLWRSSRTARPASRRVLRGVLPALLVAACVGQGIAQLAPATVPEDAWLGTYHDAQGTGSIEFAVVLRGGGGRARAPVTVEDDPRTFVRVSRPWTFDQTPGAFMDSVLVTRTVDGKLRVGLDREGPSASRVLVTSRLRVTDADPPLSAALRVEGTQLSGELRASRALSTTMLIHPGGVAWLGPLRAGEAVDLTRVKLAAAEAPVDVSPDMLRLLRRSATEPRGRWDWDAPVDADQWVSIVADLRQCVGGDRKTLCPSPWSVVAEEEAESVLPGFSEGGRPIRARRVHIQRLAVAESPDAIHYRLPVGAGEGWKVARALSDRLGGAYRPSAAVTSGGCEYSLGPAAPDHGTMVLGGERDGFVEVHLRAPFCDLGGENLLRFTRKP